SKSKVVLQEAIDAFCEEIVFDLAYAEDRVSDKSYYLFRQKYGLSKEEASTSLKQALGGINSLLKENGFEIINYSRKFLFLKSSKSGEEAENRLRNSKYLTYLGKADKLISCSPGTAIASLDGVILSPGTTSMDMKTKKGHKTFFERETVYEFARTAIEEGAESAVSYLRRRCIDLAKGRIPKHDLIYITVPHMEPEDYSYEAFKQERMKAVLEFKAKKDEEVPYGFSSGKRIEGPEFVKDGVKPDWEMYAKRFFGKTDTGWNFSAGTISDIVYSVCAGSEYSRSSLKRIFEGNTADTEQQSLIGFSKES
ncbi:MAG: hypothetical protein V1839_01390, partial [archaeon]